MAVSLVRMFAVSVALVGGIGELDVVAKDGRTPLRVADGVEYGNSFATHPHTAELLRRLGAAEIECPAPGAAEIPLEAVRQ